VETAKVKRDTRHTYIQLAPCFCDTDSDDVLNNAEGWPDGARYYHLSEGLVDKVMRQRPYAGLAGVVRCTDQSKLVTANRTLSNRTLREHYQDGLRSRQETWSSG
jgi:hypothetical protein